MDSQSTKVSLGRTLARYHQLVNVPVMPPQRVLPNRNTSPKKPNTQATSPGKRNELLSLNSRREGYCQSERYLTVEYVVCKDHLKCQHVSKKQLMELFAKVAECTVEITPYIKNDMFTPWIDGQEIIMNMSLSDLWKSSECRFCWIDDFLFGDGHIP
jgi:hypothetical protein